MGLKVRVVSKVKWVRRSPRTCSAVE
jgi:hypothetical protein